jgi:serine/threonine protein phosphatase PrpC
MNSLIESLVGSVAHPAFSWATACTTGAAHAASGLPCQDAFAVQAGSCRSVPYLVAVVADGAGSAMYAEEASKLAVRLFTDFIVEELPVYGFGGLDDLLLDAAYGVHRHLRRLADERSVSADDFATTLLGLVTTRNRTAFLQIGDGAIVTGPPWAIVFEPQHGQFHNESRFITDADAFDRLEHRVRPGPPGTIVLFTDGLEDLVLAPKSLAVHPPLFDHIAAGLALPEPPGLRSTLSAELADQLTSGAVRSRTDDDTTLLAIRFHGDDR